jgi:hypothetical protein
VLWTRFELMCCRFNTGGRDRTCASGDSGFLERNLVLRATDTLRHGLEMVSGSDRTLVNKGWVAKRQGLSEGKR